MVKASNTGKVLYHTHDKGLANNVLLSNKAGDSCEESRHDDFIVKLLPSVSEAIQMYYHYIAKSFFCLQFWQNYAHLSKYFGQYTYMLKLIKKIIRMILMPDWSYHTIFKPILHRLPPVFGRKFIHHGMNSP